MITDVNVSISRWPFRRVPGDDGASCSAKLRSLGVTQAWTGSLDGLFHKDVAAVNTRLVDDCRRSRPGLLLPFGTVNPTLPDWREDLRRCHEHHQMRGIRLHPGYHGYTLDAPEFAELLTLAEQRGLIVQLVVRMEDPRTQHPLMRVPDVDTRPLPTLVAERPTLRVVLLNALRTPRRDALTQLTRAGHVYFEIAMLEGVGGISKTLRHVAVERLLFGSHFPLFIPESAVLKLRESDLTLGQRAAITHKNAQDLLTGN